MDVLGISFFHPHWPVIYSDNHLLAIYKPAGLIMQRDRPQRLSMLDLAKLWVKDRWQKPGRVYLGMVHRLDAPVAGVVLLARTSKAAGRISRQIRKKSVQKSYLAVIQAKLPSHCGELEHHLLRQGRTSRVVAAGTPDSRRARLGYCQLDHSADRSLVKIDLETGRRHQIRLQMAAMGCPIVGDVRYGASQPLAHGRIALLSMEMIVDHPTTAERLTFSSPLPVGWPWHDTPKGDAPLWTVEDFMAAGWQPPEPDPSL